MDFLGQLVWSLTLAIGTSSLRHNVQRRHPEGQGSSHGKRWSTLANTRLAVVAGYFALHMKYVPSNETITDAPSRTLSDIDCSLCEEAWARVQARFGPHTLQRKG